MTHQSWVVDHMDAAPLEDSDLVPGATLAAGYDSSCVAHAAARRRGDPSNEADYREVAVVIVCEPLCGLFLGLSSDLTDHDDPLGLLVRDEAF